MTDEKDAGIRATTVDGLEQFCIMRKWTGDTDPATLIDCNRCGHEAMYVEPGHRYHMGNGGVHVECSNTSCGLRIPAHYKTREDAAKAWNRKVP